MRLAVSDVVGQTGGVAVRGVLREVGARLCKAPRDERLKTGDHSFLCELRDELETGGEE